MHNLKKELMNRKIELEKQMKDVKNWLRDAPKGDLRISTKGKVDQYYLLTPEIRKTLKNGKYIRRENEAIAKKIATRDYLRSCLNALEIQYSDVLAAINAAPWENLDHVYEALPRTRKRIVSPYLASDQVYLSKWRQEEYMGLSFAEGTAIYLTDLGERVRSKSEKILADYMSKNGIPYKYEKPLTLHYNNRPMRTIYPDFTILDIYNRREVYFEHLGMMHDPEYVRRNMRKIEDYERCGIFPGERLILTYECDNIMTDTRVIEQLLAPYCCPDLMRHETGAQVSDQS